MARKTAFPLSAKNARDVHTKLALMQETMGFKKAVHKGGSTSRTAVEEKRTRMQEHEVTLNMLIAAE